MAGGFHPACVIDEIQNIEDAHRGWAWTNAICSINAPLVYLCGEERALKICAYLIDATGGTFQVKRFHRRTSVIETRSLEKLSNAQPGDCIVYYSLKQLMEDRAQMRQKTNVIIGSFPANTKLLQAKDFSEGESVLLTTSAITQGLNLNIKRIYVRRLHFFSEQGTRYLNSSELGQIAGRAGRMHGKYPNGFFGTFSASQAQMVSLIVNRERKYISELRILPQFRELRLLQGEYPELLFSELVDQLIWKLDQECSSSSIFQKGNTAKYRWLSKIADEYDLSLEEKILLISVPVNIKSKKQLFLLRRIAECLENNFYLSFLELKDILKGEKSYNKYHLLSLYSWITLSLKKEFEKDEISLLMERNANVFNAEINSCADMSYILSQS